MQNERHIFGQQTRSARRQPACVALACLITGILVDRLFPVRPAVWFALIALACCGWGVSRRAGRFRGAAVYVCVVVACLGGLHHHLRWYVLPPNDVSHRATETFEPVIVVGELVTRPVPRVKQDEAIRGGRPEIVRTACLVACCRLENPATGKSTTIATQPIQGRIRLTVSGHLVHVQVGDTIRIHGLLALIAGPDNPGEYDFRRYIRGKGVRCGVYADHPSAIERIESSGRFHVGNRLASLRDQAQVILQRHLDASTMPTAAALLLGNREFLRDEVRETFVESGTMHLLAISGLHVGILALLVLAMCRVLGVSPGTSAALLIGVVVSYAVITDARPSVVRAAILISLAVAGRGSLRNIDLNNSLWVAGLILLGLNPSDVFDVGAQLSFLSVVAISLTTQFMPSFRVGWLSGPIVNLTFAQMTHTVVAQCLRKLLQGYWMMLGIVLLTSPVVATEFGVVSVVGMVINVLLLPFMAPVIWLGFGLLFCGFLIPFLAAPLGWCFQFGLHMLLVIVQAAAGMNGGHVYVANPAGWWIACLYVLVAVLIWGLWTNRPTRFVRRSICGLMLWWIIGLTHALLPNTRDELQVSFLSVGHGLCVFVRTPDNHTLLYDCGSTSSSTRAERVADAALRTYGASMLNAVVISHADSDHYNGVRGILKRFPVAGLFINESAARNPVPHLLRVLDAANDRQVPIRILQAGDRFQLGADVRVNVLHPPADNQFLADSDNASSLVLNIQFGDRAILLTGDLEENGLDLLLSGPNRQADIILAPHHGSKLANPVTLANYSGAAFAVASAARKDKVGNLYTLAAKPIRMFNTSKTGAVTFKIPRNGALDIKTFHSLEIE